MKMKAIRLAWRAALNAAAVTTPTPEDVAAHATAAVAATLVSVHRSNPAGLRDFGREVASHLAISLIGAIAAVIVVAAVL